MAKTKTIKRVAKNRKSKKPDRSSGSYTLAHDWEYLGDGERIPRWPSKTDERTVRVIINTYVGTCAIGAKHWTVTVDVRQQQYWCERENTWVELSCDMDREYSLSASVMRLKDAQNIAQAFIKIIEADPTQKWRIDWNDVDED